MIFGKYPLVHQIINIGYLLFGVLVPVSSNASTYLVTPVIRKH